MAKWIAPDLEDKEMLAELGISSVEELFRDVPKKARIKRMGLPSSLTEREVVKQVRSKLSKNEPLEAFDSFLGGGAYNRYTPAVVDGILQRSEFYTAYTPYQAEASQGTLQAMFEFQSLWCELTNMEVANASLYDGASALAEAMLMAARLHEGHRILVPGSLFWERRSVLENYSKGIGLRIETIPFDMGTGLLDLDFVERESKKDTAAVVVEFPDTFGLVDERFNKLKSRIGEVPLIVNADPLSLTLLEPPGSWGADIVVAEGQGFGIPLSYGGPLLGLMACRSASVRQLPGRISGMTKDHDGKRAFTLTLQTREQHIRRSRATSNVCTNHTLIALGFLVYATAMGPRGLRELATGLAKRSRELSSSLGKVAGLRAPLFSAPHLFDFVVGIEGQTAERFLEAMYGRGILAGTHLNDPRPGAKPLPFQGFLTSVDENTDEGAITRYAKAAADVLGSKQ